MGRIVALAATTLLFAAGADAQDKMYFVDSGTDTIHRANLDGSSLENVITSGISNPQEIVIEDGKMYWADSGTGLIERANLDGTSRECLIGNSAGCNNMTSLTAPTGVAVDSTNSHLYFISDSSVRRANLDGTSITSLVIGLDQPVRIALDVSGNRMYWTESGSTEEISRANLDGSSVECLIGPSSAGGCNAVTGIDNPWDVELDLSGGMLYYTTIGNDVVARAALDGSGNTTLFSANQSGSQGLDLELAGGKLYWTDHNVGAGTAEVNRSNLDGSTPQTLLTESDGISRPKGIALGSSMSPTPTPTPAPAPSTESIPVLPPWGLFALLGLILLASTRLLRSVAMEE